MIRKYVVVQGALNEQFVGKISKLLREDWEPLGGVAVCPDGNVMQALGQRDGTSLARMQSEMTKFLEDHYSAKEEKTK